MKTILFKIILGIWFVAWTPLLLLGLVSRKLSRRFIALDAQGVLWLAKVIAGIKLKIHGKPSAPIIASKHMSIMETAIFGATLPDSFFILKRELLWIPVYGWSFWRAGMQGVNRTRGATNMQKLVKSVSEKIVSGQKLVIFPEGTRAKPGEKIKLKRGLMFISESLKLPIQPVSLDTGVYWPKKGKMKPGTANMYYEPVLPFDATLEEIAEAISRHSA